MIEIHNTCMNTAGAYVRIDGYYVFAIGIRPHNGQFPVVRLGGHREGNETGWQCAVREVYEESRLRVRPHSPQRTYLSDGDQNDSELHEIRWDTRSENEPDPILVVAYRRTENILLSMMYLAQTNESPRPSSEVKGLLLLREEDIHDLCRTPVTLEQYLSKGGKAILSAQFDTELVLEPFTQLRLLSEILRRNNSS
jgi:hypothetical protein